MSTARIVITTIDSRERAETLAQQLVEARLAACVNIVGPIHSVYRWQGKINKDEEFLLLVKTTAETAARLRSTMKQLHPYELPECIELSIEAGSDEYLAWIAAETSAAE